MPDPDPNPKVTLAGSGVLLHGLRDDGEIIPIEVTDAGELKTTATVSTVGLATEATLSALNAKITTAEDTQPGNTAATLVRLVQASDVSVVVTNQAFATAIPGSDASGQLVRVIPTDRVDMSRSLCVSIADDHPAIETSGRAFIATREKGLTPTGEPTSIELSADLQALHVRDPLGATEAKQDDTIAAIQNLDSKIPFPVDDQIPVVAASLPLPTGAATEAKQDDGNASVASIDTKTPALVGGRIPVDGSGVTQPVSDGGGSLTVDGTVTATISGSAAVVGPSALGAIDSTSAPVLVGARSNSNEVTSLRVGNVASNKGDLYVIPGGSAIWETRAVGGGALALDATLTGGTQQAIARGGAKGATTAATVTSTAEGADHQALDVQIYHGGAAKDPTQIRALTASDVVSADLRVSSAAVTTTNPVPVQSIATELAPSWVRGPEDGFGRTVMIQPTPVLQSTFANGVTVDTWRFYLTGTATATTTAQSDSMATVATGATGSSVAELTSMDSFSYRSGQSVRVAFTTVFSAPSSGGFQVVGCGSNDGFAVGYDGTAFGFLVRRGGVAEIRTLTITTASTTAENVTVTLNGVGTSVAVTNSGNTTTTAREIAAGNYSASGAGWDAYQFGATVIFVARQPGPLSGSYSLTATTAVGSFAQTLAGVAPTDTWYAKTAWNGDRLDGATGANNLSGATLDPTKLSIWQIVVPYLGAGNAFLQWFDPTSGRWTTCHTVTVANTTATTIVRNPMFRLWMRASGASNISASSASIALFCDGIVESVGPRIAIPPSFKTDVGNASERPLVAIRIERYYNGAENRAPFRPIELAVSAGATGQVLLRFYLNPTLTAHNFGAVNALHPIAYDTSATSSSGGLLVGAIITSPSGGSTPISLLNLGYTLQPGDVVGVTAQQTNGTNGTVAVAFTGILDNGSGGI